MEAECNVSVMAEELQPLAHLLRLGACKKAPNYPKFSLTQVHSNANAYGRHSYWREFVWGHSAKSSVPTRARAVGIVRFQAKNAGSQDRQSKTAKGGRAVGGLAILT